LAVDGLRRAITELGPFLELEAPGGGHDPTVLRVEHAHRFTADQCHREQRGLDSRVMKRVDGISSPLPRTTRCAVTNGVRKLLRDALDYGDAERLGLAREFIVAMPTAGYVAGRNARRPFPDEVARALAGEANLPLLVGADPEGDVVERGGPVPSASEQSGRRRHDRFPAPSRDGAAHRAEIRVSAESAASRHQVLADLGLHAVDGVSVAARRQPGVPAACGRVVRHCVS
jgi:hypothetical protein